MGSDFPDVGGEHGPLPLGVVELLDRLDLPCLSVGEGLHRRVEGGPMLSEIRINNSFFRAVLREDCGAERPTRPYSTWQGIHQRQQQAAKH